MAVDRTGESHDHDLIMERLCSFFISVVCTYAIFLRRLGLSASEARKGLCHLIDTQPSFSLFILCPRTQHAPHCSLVHRQHCCLSLQDGMHVCAFKVALFSERTRESTNNKKHPATESVCAHPTHDRHRMRCCRRVLLCAKELARVDSIFAAVKMLRRCSITSCFDNVA